MALVNDLLALLLPMGFMSHVLGYFNACMIPYWLFWSCQFGFLRGFGEFYFVGLGGSGLVIGDIPGLAGGTLLLPPGFLDNIDFWFDLYYAKSSANPFDG